MNWGIRDHMEYLFPWCYYWQYYGGHKEKEGETMKEPTFYEVVDKLDKILEDANKERPAKYVMYWNGGLSYSPPTDADAEPVSSIKKAVALCKARRANIDGRTPCVEYSEDNCCAACLYVGSGSVEAPDYPDVVIVWTGRTFRPAKM